MNYRTLLLLGLCSITLQGCVAVAAIPIVAGGGALVRNSVSDDARSKTQERVTIVAPDDSAPAPSAAPALISANFAGEQTQQSVAAPALAEAEPVSAPAGLPGTAGSYAALKSYALRTVSEGRPPRSAMLADHINLLPVRRECQSNTPAVVVDLDPAGGLVPIDGPARPNSELARSLAELRMRDVQIVWVTDRSPTDARAIREQLATSGLDPELIDALYVERYPGETKQARRVALSQNRCVIALVGDERADFDELYNYLIDPGDARDLEPLIGNGWFLIENPVGQ